MVSSSSGTKAKTRCRIGCGRQKYANHGFAGRLIDAAVSRFGDKGNGVQPLRGYSISATWLKLARLRARRFERFAAMRVNRARHRDLANEPVGQFQQCATEKIRG